MEAMIHAIEDISGMYDGVTRALYVLGSVHVDLLANKPRRDTDLETNPPQEITIPTATIPACFATPSISATKTDLLDPM